MTEAKKPELLYRDHRLAKEEGPACLLWFRQECERIWKERTGKELLKTEYAVKFDTSMSTGHRIGRKMEFHIHVPESFSRGRGFSIRKNGTLNEDGVFEKLSEVVAMAQRIERERAAMKKNRAAMDAQGIASCDKITIDASRHEGYVKVVRTSFTSIRFIQSNIAMSNFFAVREALIEADAAIQNAMELEH